MWLSRRVLLLLVGAGIMVALAMPSQVLAECTVTVTDGPVSCNFNNNCAETCVTLPGGGAGGATYYNCDTYCTEWDSLNNCIAGEYGCYYNGYICDGGTGCGGAGSGGGVDAYDYPTCSGGQVLACATPPRYLAGGGTTTSDVSAQCTFKATCGNSYFPSAFFPNDCAGEDTANRGICQTNCGCCDAGQELVDTGGGNYACQAVCGLNAPRVTVTQGSSASQAIISWINAKGGSQTLVRFGSNISDVESGCWGGTCLYPPSPGGGVFPVYTHPADPGGAGAVMYYYKYSANGCTNTAPKTTYAQCEADVDQWVNNADGSPDSPGICYESMAKCNEFSTGSVTVNGIAQGVNYRARVVNFLNNSCRPAGFDDHMVDCVATSPATPSTSSPVAPASTLVSLSWSESNWGIGCPSNNNTFTYFVSTLSSPPESSAIQTVPHSQTGVNFTATAGVTYYWKVRASNGSYGADSIVRSFTVPLPIQITGTVYNDSANVCSTATRVAGVTVRLNGTAVTTTNASGNYTITVPNNTTEYTVSIDPPSGYLCSTGPGCSSCSQAGVTGGDTANFFVTNNREGWWQAVGGSIYAAGNVSSELPSSSTYLIDVGTGGAIGALLRATSATPDLGSGSVSTAGYTAQTRHRGKTMNYDYFAAHLGVTPNTDNYWVSNTMSEPTTTEDFYYLKPTGGSPAIIPVTGLSVGVTESYIMLVNGDLQIDGNVTVAPGGFLAIIVNGNITVSPSVTSVQGLYMADGQLVTQSSANPANFEGSVVAWSGVDLNRDLGTGNVTTPAEKFTYRADLLLNMPELMKVFALKWEEVVPGTF